MEIMHIWRNHDLCLIYTRVLKRSAEWTVAYHVITATLDADILSRWPRTYK